MRRRHDPFLKRLYRAGTPDAISLFLLHLAERIDWSQWQWIDKEVPIKGRQRPRSVVADLVGLTRDREGRYLKVLVHPEIQMVPDATMGERVLEYNAGLLLREGVPGTRVLTVVFYHCAGMGGIREQPFALDYYGTSVHGVTYWSVGLGELEAETYAEADNPMGWALASWMRKQREGRAELRLRLLEKILRHVRVESYQELLFDTIQSYYKLSRSEAKQEERLLRSGRFGEVEEMAQTVLGRIEARARREAERETLQRTAVDVITAKFPIVPETLLSRVEHLRDLKRLNDLIRRAATASDLSEIEVLLDQ
jgi:hypothetical protein